MGILKLAEGDNDQVELNDEELTKMQEREAIQKLNTSIIDGLKKLQEAKKIKARSRYKMPKAEPLEIRRNESIMARESRNVRQHSMVNAEKYIRTSKRL
jgi:hypothetical protein